MKERKTICIGTSDIASQFKDLRRAFNDHGYNVINVVNDLPYSPIIQKDNYDYVLSKKRPFLFRQPIFPTTSNYILKVIRKIHSMIRGVVLKKITKSFLKDLMNDCDYFLFIWSSFLPDFSDYEYIKSKGKKIIVIFCGDDVRWYPGMIQEYTKYNMEPPEYEDISIYTPKLLNDRLQSLRKAERFADYIFSKREQGQIQLRPFYHFPMFVCPADYQENTSQREFNPVVVHAPSNENFKGTKYVLEAFEKLKKEGVLFTYILLKSKEHKEAIKIYRDADILIDQVLCPGGGRLATESLASGTIVMARMEYETYEQGFDAYNESPIVDVNPQNLYVKLKELILNYEKRVALAKKGRPYVEKYLDAKKFTGKIIDLFNDKFDKPFDHNPTFYRNEFIPESNKAKLIFNKWNKFVKGTKWYQEGISPGERDGLKF